MVHKKLLRAEAVMKLIGTPTINPILFYSGKICGYITWITLLISLIKPGTFSINTPRSLKITSYFILGTGLALAFISLFNLGKSVRLGLPKEKTIFKSNGLYKISRNPMYLGFNLITISSIVYHFNICILTAGFYSILIYHRIIIGEESFLEKAFGEDYKEYKKKVRRYL